MTKSSKYTGKMDTYEENIKINMRNNLLFVFNNITKNIDDVKYKKKLSKILDDYLTLIENEIVNKLIEKYGIVNDLEVKLFQYYSKDKNIDSLGNEIKKISKILMMKTKLNENKTELKDYAKKYVNKIKL